MQCGGAAHLVGRPGTTVIFVTALHPRGGVPVRRGCVVMSRAAGRIAGTVEIDLPQPRDDDSRESDRYYDLVTEVREALRGRSPMRPSRGPDWRALSSRRLVRMTTLPGRELGPRPRVQDRAG